MYGYTKLFLIHMIYYILILLNCMFLLHLFYLRPRNGTYAESTVNKREKK